MYPGPHAKTQPNKPAVIRALTGEAVTYGMLDERSNRFAQLLYARGFRRGDHIALMMENNLRMFEIAWAAFRSGLYLTAINRYLTPEEAAYIINDCEARALVSTQYMAETVDAAMKLVTDCPHRFMVDGPLAGWETYEEAIEAHSLEPLAEEPAGEWILYSSGTTGRPKGVARPLPEAGIDAGLSTNATLLNYGFDADSIYLSPAPLYHAAPFAYTTGVQSLGGTVVFMDRFDELGALELIEKYKITHSQWVPTMFIRMLKMSAEDRGRYDLSTLKVAVHAAAPCPVDIKQRMIDWWGPILLEYYAGTERNGATFIRSDEWLQRRGSVGRASRGIIHICDDDGAEMPVGKEGVIYFEMPVVPFEYYNDPERTKAALHPEHENWSTLNDVGYVDEAGYLFLTDRKSFMIISGGVNIYPQAIEDALVLHPSVADVAVIGVPDEDMGEQVKAVVQPMDGIAGDDTLAAALIEHTRAHVARYMVPKSVDFTDAIPRLPTGKLYKKDLRDSYWQGHSKRV
jgi:long-chain acyl-CoA synthetase